MEVYLRNVPVDLTENSLNKELKPYTNALGILDWGCDKARRKDFASITFLNTADGAKFLGKHERLADQNPDASGRRRRDVARLFILQTPIFVTKSKRNVDKHTLSHLKNMREDRKKRPDRGSHAPALVCNVLGLACGKNVFAGPSATLTFAQQLRVDVVGRAKFGQRCLTATFNDSARMDVPYDIIETLVADHTPAPS